MHLPEVFRLAAECVGDLRPLLDELRDVRDQHFLAPGQRLVQTVRQVDLLDLRSEAARVGQALEGHSAVTIMSATIIYQRRSRKKIRSDVNVR